MALATYGDKGLWANPVYFAWDSKFRLYFISQLDCVHMDNIRTGAVVNCAIFPTDRPCGNDVFGAYIQGAARILENGPDKKNADEVYYGRVYPDDPDGKKKNADGYRMDPSWHFVKIVPSGLWYFDTRYFDERRVAVPDAVWK